MYRYLATVGLIVLACVLCSIYGAIHNQFTFSISKEYFTEFKFKQFEVPSTQWNRQGAALVGIEATWWLGLAFNVFLIPAALLIRCDRRFVTAMLQAYGIIILAAILTAMIGYAAALVLQTFDTEPTSFKIVGMIHNSSYLGGALGTLFGIAYLFRVFLRESAATSKQRLQDDVRANHH